MRIVTDEDRRSDDALVALMDRAAELALRREGPGPERCEISLSFVTPEEIGELNARYMGKEGATDVLSFPMYESLEEILGEVFREDCPTVLLGDVVICREIAVKQAEEYGHSIERELAYLFVHSVFHLLGYNHEDEEGKRAMRTAEEDVLRELGVEI
jgi:probable rRNA maturation factor